MNEIFEQRYATLNAEQRRAVDATEGPVMVIAGPGTGKTEILAARICNILKQTDTDARNILCLTYTEAGTQAMRMRLLMYMGDEAYKVNIHTYHSLCKYVLDTYSVFFGNKQFEVIDELQKNKLLEQLLNNLDINHPLYTGKVSDELAVEKQGNFGIGKRDYFDFFRVITENNLQKSELEERIIRLRNEDDFKIAFPDCVYKRKSKENQVGDLKRADYDKIHEGFEKLLGLWDVYAAYEQEKDKMQVADFEDLLQWVYKKLGEETELNFILQEQFQYILVDEFQDNNALQTNILYKLIEFYEDNPNCFVVGDDDQSIYSFQGSDVANMMTFYTKYKTNLNVICLTQNYRSSQVVLNIAQKYIVHNTDRLASNIEGVSKNLEASGAFAEVPDEPVLYNFSNEENMLSSIALEIKNKIAGGVKPKEIAVLARKGHQLNAMAMALKMEKVDYELARGVDILKEPLIKEVLRWLQFVNMECSLPGQGGAELFKLLYTQPVNLLEVHRLYATAAYGAIKTIDVLEYLCSNENGPLDLFKPTLAPIASNILQLIKIWQHESAPAVLMFLYEEFGFIKKALSAPDKRHQLQLLYTLMQKMEELSKANPHESMEFYLNQIMDYINYDIAIPISTAMQMGDGVQLITMHSSKGLEFEQVYILNVDAAGQKPKSKSTFKSALRNAMVNHLFTHPQFAELGKDLQAQMAELENRRLWYVAYTRAKKNLYLCSGNSNRPYEKIGELAANMLVEDRAPVEEGIEKLILAKMQSTELDSKQRDELWYKSKLKDYVFSHSSVVAILKCENTFYYQNILGVPSVGSVYMSYGSAVHKAMHVLIKTWTAQERKLSVEEFVQVFEMDFYRNRGLISKGQYETKLREGKELLTYYYEQRSSEIWAYDNVQTEMKLSTAINNVPIKGYVDKIYFTRHDGNAATIVDYKTGKAANAKKKFKEPAENNKTIDTIDVGKSEYWLQGVLYAFMVQKIHQNWSIKQLEIETLSTQQDEFEKLIYVPKPEDYTLVEQLVSKASDRLHAPNFPLKCADKNCTWCNFKESHRMPVEEME